MDRAPNDRQDEHDTPIRLHGREVSRCYCDTAFGIQFFDKANEFTIRIEGTFTLKLAGQTFSLTHLRRSALGPALELYGKIVDRAVATQDGSLFLTFSDETEIVVHPNDRYEAWGLSGPDGLLLVSLPGGGLAVWERREVAPDGG
jgi:hypothetical protein